jgi:hypothetical protein
MLEGTICLYILYLYLIPFCCANLTTYGYVSYEQIFNSLNSLELKSLEEPLYLFGQFFKKPLECLTLGMKTASLQF